MDLSSIWQELATKVLPWIENATIPIGRLNPDTADVRLDRTGVFLRIADEYFILTASHGLKENADLGRWLFAMVKDGSHPVVPLECVEFAYTETESRDVAVLFLLPGQASAIARSKTPISLGNCEINEHPQTGFYLTSGYPSDPKWFLVDADGFSPRLLTFLGANFKESTEPIARMEYDPRIHMVVDFASTARQVDPNSDYSEWRDESLPRYQGMRGISGCGIWRLNPKGGLPMLAAIQHRYHATKGYVHGSRMRLALELLFESRPNLKSAASIVYPRR